MGLGTLLGRDDGGQRGLCRGCGRTVRIDDDDEPRCPECGSTDVTTVALL